MTHTCTKVTVRQRAIRNNRISLYLDYYPAARSAEREGFEQSAQSSVYQPVIRKYQSTPNNPQIICIILPLRRTWSLQR